jgi:hypothetical protein
VRQKRKVVEATVPARISGARVWLPARRINAVAEVVRRRLASNKLGEHSTKMEQRRVNGGLALGDERRVTPSFGTGSERYVGAPDSPV